MNVVSPGSAISHAAQHLAHDHLDVLVVDLHALQAVDVLHLVDDVARQRLDAQQAQDVVRVGRAVDDRLALVHDLAVVHQDVLLLRASGTRATLPSGSVMMQAHACPWCPCRTDTVPVISASMPRVLRRAGFEQLGHARQTAGDVAGLLALRAGSAPARRRQPTSWPSRTVDRARRPGSRCVTEWSVPAILTSSPVASSSLTCGRTDLGRAAALRVDHHQCRQAGDLVDLLGDGHAFLDVLELRSCRRYSVMIGRVSGSQLGQHRRRP
jgi:hypothetical protein